MNNSESPINPTVYADLHDNGGEIYCDQTGLTKLEYFAGLAMQSLLVSGAIDCSVVAKDSVTYAKAMLEEFDNMEK